MNVATIQISTLGSTTELQDWLDAHPTVTIDRILVMGSVFYIFYE